MKHMKHISKILVWEKGNSYWHQNIVVLVNSLADSDTSCVSPSVVIKLYSSSSLTVATLSAAFLPLLSNICIDRQSSLLCVPPAMIFRPCPQRHSKPIHFICQLSHIPHDGWWKIWLKCHPLSVFYGLRLSGCGVVFGALFELWRAQSADPVTKQLSPCHV